MNRWFTTADENAAPGGMTGLVGAFSLERDHEGVKRRAVRRLEQLGYQVTLAPLMVVAA